MAKDDPTEGGPMANVTRLRESVALLPQTLSRLDACSLAIPRDQDFHFYANFSEFRDLVVGIQSRVQPLLSRISALPVIPRAPSWPSDPDDSRDWLVGVQDEILERVDSAFDAFKKEKAKQGSAVDDDGFMYQKARKKRRREGKDVKETQLPKDSKGNAGVILTSSTKTERCPVPFHVWSIPRPQDKFDVPVDNSNTPFKHPKRLPKCTLAETSTSPIPADTAAETQSVDSTKPTHPLEDELRNMTFDVCRAVGTINAKKPKSLAETPFTFIDSPAALKDLSAKLLLEREIAVDLEHHQFRSFLGLTCLMQISTQSEDFIIDTLELRSCIGTQLQDVFANPNIEKVMHGADWDISWLQRDFRIYVCNLFDTGQASRVLGLKSYGLSYLLEQFCGVVTDKRYQLADWRLRPLPTEMLKYAREDTHYLLFVKDVMKEMLVSTQCGDLIGEEPLLEVYKRSRDICSKLYEKEITTERSFLQVYGLHEKQFGAEQLAVLAGLYSWRDQVARREDESTGYVLPNHFLLKLAEEMPDSVKKLRSMLSSRHALVTRNMAAVVDIISKSKLKASSFINESFNLRLEAEKTKNILGNAFHFETPTFDESNLDITKGEVTGGAVSPRLNSGEYEKTKNIACLSPISFEGPNDDRIANVKNIVKDYPQAMVNEIVTEHNRVAQQTEDKVDANPKSAEGLSCFTNESPSQHKESGAGATASRVVVNRSRTSMLFGKENKRDPPNIKPESSLPNECVSASSPRLDKSVKASREALDHSKERKNVQEQKDVQKDEESPHIKGTFSRSHAGDTAMTGTPVSTRFYDQSTSTARVARKPLGGLPSLLGRKSTGQPEARSHRAIHENPDEMESRLKAAEIRASLVLPFHTFDGAHPSQHAASEHEETSRKCVVSKERNVNDLEQPPNDCDRDLQSEEIILFDADVDSPGEEHGEGKLTEHSHLQISEGSGTNDESEAEHANDSLGLSRKGICFSKDGSMHRQWWPVVLSPRQQIRSDSLKTIIKEQENTGYLNLEQIFPVPEKPFSVREQIEAQDKREPPLSSLRNRISSELSEFGQGRSYNAHYPQFEGMGRGQFTSLSDRDVKVRNCEESCLPFEPFDYAAAKRTMHYVKGFTELDDDKGSAKNGSKPIRQYNHGNYSSGNETFFDPHRRKDFRPEGISPGKRRQVFPQTGNRTGTFK